MKNFLKILQFEYLTCVKNKAFIITTILLVGLMVLGCFIPSIIAGFTESEDDGENNDKVSVLAVNAGTYDSKTVTEVFDTFFKGNQIKVTDESSDVLKEKVDKGDYTTAIYIDSPLSFTIIKQTVSVYGEEHALAAEAIKHVNMLTTMESLGLSKEDGEKILSVDVQYEIVTTGKDQSKNYLPAYIIMIVLFAAIASYGQSVALSVVNEKNTRAMELLITCAKPKHLIFGKVIGSGLAGLTQLTIILMAALASFGPASQSGMPAEFKEYFTIQPQTVVLAIVFFLLGFFTFAFLMGALASFASKAEDLNNLTSPIVMILTFVYMAVVFSCTSDNTDSVFMTVLSYVPFAAPMAMLVRATMTDVAVWEIALSIGIQIVTVYLLGMLAAAIYKIGVLMYGNPPKLGEIFKMLSMSIKEQNKK